MAYVRILVCSLGKGCFHPFLESLERLECDSGHRGHGGRGAGGGVGGNRPSPGFTLLSWRPPAPLKFHLERSFLADKIKAFPQPNHYLTFEAIIELIVSISQVSSCSRLSPSAGRSKKKGSAGPGRRAGDEGAGAGPGRGAVRLLSAETGRGRAWGRPSEDGRTPRLLARPAPAAGALPSAARCGPGGRAG